MLAFILVDAFDFASNYCYNMGDFSSWGAGAEYACVFMVCVCVCVYVCVLLEYLLHVSNLNPSCTK